MARLSAAVKGTFSFTHKLRMVVVQAICGVHRYEGMYEMRDAALAYILEDTVMYICVNTFTIYRTNADR